ncbi:uncharacterized protein LOC128720208 [Anopheles nili]|uniref:uncharacterized protein LOC128720208 n=1 Tax=Anopheles nili TaxID=185578 RepID=UPI00237A230C|nr:uncharacterized protein LOC128720208 [Anopheles nili]
MTGKEHNDYYFGNLSKSATEEELRRFLTDYGEIIGFEFRLEQCTFCPTKIAFIMFANALSASTIAELNAKKFLEKRLFVAPTNSEKFFTPLLSVVVRYLNEHITEEDLYTYFHSIGPVVAVQKPMHNYAYVLFEDNASLKHAFAMKDLLKGIKPYIVAVQRKIGMFLEHRIPIPYASIRAKCDKLDMIYDPASENETTLLISNIPRDTEEDDVLDFLAKFGKIVDWEMQKSAICVMSQIGYVTYQHPKMARYAFICGPLHFQGFGMEVYNQRLRYTSQDSNQTVIIRRTSVYLTNDEIFEKCSEYGLVQYIQRIDAINYNTIVRLDSEKAAKKLMYITRIAGEDVQMRLYTVKQYLQITVAPIDTDSRKPPKRSRKVSMLMHINDIEDRKNLVKLPTEFFAPYLSPNPNFYRNEVQVWNYPPKQGMVEFREYFKKYGTVINLRELKEPGASSGVIYLSFDTKLEAKRICKLNHSFMCSRRLLIFMADQYIVYDPKLCVKVSNLSEEILDEDVYDRFSMIGQVKYVFRPRVPEAVVCMGNEKLQSKGLKVLCVGRFCVTVSPLFDATIQTQTELSHVDKCDMLTLNTTPSAMQNVNDHFMLASSVSEGPPLWLRAHMGMRPMSTGQMGPTSGNMMMPALQTPPSFVVPVPQMPTALIRPNAFTPFSGSAARCTGAYGSVQLGSHQISPRMRGLMQTLEAQMIKSTNFTSLSMTDQFNLVRGIIDQCINFAPFLSLDADEKIRCLINGQNGFQYVNIFTLFMYPEQLKMLAIIERYYRSTCDPASGPLTQESSITMDGGQQATTNKTVSTQDLQDISTADPRVRDINQVIASDEANDDEEAIPPAPSPPPISCRSRSVSPDLEKDQSSANSSFNGAAQKRMCQDSVEEPPKKSVKTSEKKNATLKPMVYVSNLSKDVTEQYINNLFSKYGLIKSVIEPKTRSTDTKSMVIRFNTMRQANAAKKMHLTTIMGRLIRVGIYNDQYKARPEYAVVVSCTGLYSEIAIYETFKSCGKIGYLWTRKLKESDVCVIDFEDSKSAIAALKITYLHNGNRCKATTFTVSSKPPMDDLED